MSSLRRFAAVLIARNREFVRDRSSMGWYLIFPVLLLGSMVWIFGDEDRAEYKVGVVGEHRIEFLDLKYIEFVTQNDPERALRNVSRHQIDMLIDLSDDNTVHYWINSSSPKGYILEQVLKSNAQDLPLSRNSVEGEEVEYVDWLIPGILGMNMMFGCLFGVGYVIVRYRKNGFLKRLHATPLHAMEFITAQLASRLFLVMFVTVVVFVGAHLIIGIRVDGGYLDLFVMTLLGAISMISLGLLVAARVTSEELAGALLNMVSWPMMVISGVWFSLEGTPRALQVFAKIFPLTHMLNGLRGIMFDGKSLIESGEAVLPLLGMTALFLIIGAKTFKWHPE